MGLILEGSQPLLPSGGASLSDATPAALGTAAAGVSTSASRADHVHEAPAAGGTYTSGTLAARPASPAAGDTYEVTSGTALGDRYACFVAGAWEITGYSRVRLDETPYHWWRLDDASGGAVDSGSGATNLAEAGSGAGTLVYRAPLDPATGIRLTGSTGARRLQGAQDAGVAITTAVTLAAWVRADSTSGNKEVLALETNQGTNGQPYFSAAVHIANGELRVWVTTTASPGAGQSLLVPGIVAGCLHHVGLTFGSSTLTAWIDGVAVGSMAIAGTTIFTAGSVERWVIGDAIGPGERFTGRLADERVYTTAKDASWWAETYARGVGSYEGQ